MDDDKALLQKEIDALNDEIRQLAYKLSGLLDVDCNLGVCSYNPETDDLHAKMKEVHERKALLERLLSNIACLGKPGSGGS